MLTFASPLAAGTSVIVYSLDDRWVLDQKKIQEQFGYWDLRFLVDHECMVGPDTVLELRAVPSCSVRGRLLLPDGRPARFVGLRLEAERANLNPRWMAFASATTDAAGNYCFARRHHLDNPPRVNVASWC